jgi:hypothetical protein
VPFVRFVAMGPTIIFDKSAFQSLSLDEAVWLDALYLCNITPLFFVETLADLSLDTERNPDNVVRLLARNTPEMSPSVNAHHRPMCLASLRGHDIIMDGRPAVATLEAARGASGKLGMQMAVSDEQRAFQRWRRGAFEEVERGAARKWRTELSGIDLDAIHAHYRPIALASNPRPRDLADIRRLAEQLRSEPGPLRVPDPLWLAYSLIGVPLTSLDAISDRWRALGQPPLEQFAPYAAHVVLVDLVFNLAIGAELIGRARPTNKIDIGYLYYLPFTMVFASRDNLHVRLAPLFLQPGQSFVHGDDLKADLRRLDEYYSALPDEEKAEGVYLFAKRPPTTGDFLTARLWDKHLPAWRADTERESTRADEAASQRHERSIVEEVNSITRIRDQHGPRLQLHDDDVTFLKIERHIPIHKGKWRILPERLEREAT